MSGGRRGSTPNPARELSSLDPSLRYRCAIAGEGILCVAALNRRGFFRGIFKPPRSGEGVWGLVPRRGMGWQPHGNPHQESVVSEQNAQAFYD